MTRHATLEDVRVVRAFLRSLPATDEARALKPEMARLLALCDGELPPEGSLAHRRIKRDLFALVGHMSRIKARIEHVQPGAIEFLSQHPPLAEKGDDDGNET